MNFRTNGAMFSKGNAALSVRASEALARGLASRTSFTVTRRAWAATSSLAKQSSFTAIFQLTGKGAAYFTLPPVSDQNASIDQLLVTVCKKGLA
jgi:hypothetical protein